MRATSTALALVAFASLGCTHPQEAGPAPQGGADQAAEEARRHPTRENGQKVADELLAQWQRDHPERDWVAQENEKHVIPPPASNAGLAGRPQGETYGRITEQDLAIWEREVKKEVAEGSRIFHSAAALGSPIAVSCDMCHPDAANTHPETYPKFQVEMGRVAHLRDMINWCVQRPVRGEALDNDGPEMRALEAYILAQRKGVPLDYGKH